MILNNYGGLLAKGTGVTILLAIVGTGVGFLIGLLIGVYKTLPIREDDSTLKKVLYKVFSFLLSAYIEVFRSTPMMVQATVIFYGAAWAFGLRLDPVTAGMFIISINTGAYMAEIVRGGIISVDKGQFEATHSIGMTHFQSMLYVILPQAIRNILPATGNQFIINIKDS
ncbi:MAG: amino acid ABC transporter permease, partial [Peptococcaceae bacterium]|nr:amino acid ABC transporter permease [Peptococcaceae bacterium]